VRQRLQARPSRFSHQAGFSLVELLVTLAVIGLLAGLGLRSGVKAWPGNAWRWRVGAWLRASSVAAVRPNSRGKPVDSPSRSRAGSRRRAEL